MGFLPVLRPDDGSHYTADVLVHSRRDEGFSVATGYGDGGRERCGGLPESVRAERGVPE